MGRRGRRGALLIAVIVTTLVAACSGAPTPPSSSSSSRGSASRTGPAGSGVASSESTPAPSASDPNGAAPLIARVHWTTTAQGRQLQVFPTVIGRTDQFPAAADRAWSEVLADAPTADTPGLHDQFLCHWNFARAVDPTKTSWDLEPWRPTVGYAATVAALCNPGGPES